MTAVALRDRTLRVDTKGRVSLGRLLHDGISGFKAHWDQQNRLILEPLTEIPAREKWVFETPGVLEGLDEAMQQVKEGKVHRLDLGRFQKNLDEDV